MNIKDLLYLCKNKELDLLKEVLLENKDNLNQKFTLEKNDIVNNIEEEYLEPGHRVKYDFNSIIDCLTWFSVINHDYVITYFLLNLDFFNYRFMENTFFACICNEDINTLCKLINNGFDYKITQFKYGKNEVKKDCSCLDSALIGCLCRDKEKSVQYLINLPNVDIYDFKLSVISLVVCKRNDIFNKFIKTNKEALQYIKYLNNLKENGYQYNDEINYIKKLYNLR